MKLLLQSVILAIVHSFLVILAGFLLLRNSLQPSHLFTPLSALIIYFTVMRASSRQHLLDRPWQLLRSFVIYLLTRLLVGLYFGYMLVIILHPNPMDVILITPIQYALGTLYPMWVVSYSIQMLISPQILLSMVLKMLYEGVVLYGIVLSIHIFSRSTSKTGFWDEPNPSIFLIMIPVAFITLMVTFILEDHIAYPYDMVLLQTTPYLYLPSLVIMLLVLIIVPYILSDEQRQQIADERAPKIYTLVIMIIFSLFVHPSFLAQASIPMNPSQEFSTTVPQYSISILIRIQIFYTLRILLQFVLPLFVILSCRNTVPTLRQLAEKSENTKKMLFPDSNA